MNFLVILLSCLFLIDIVNTQDTLSASPSEFDEMTIEEKHEILIKKFLEVLSEDIDANRKHLLTPYEKDLPNINPCYLKTFRQFQDYCLQYYEKFGFLREFKELFHRACEANWLETENIGNRIKKTCEENPHLTQLYPPTPDHSTFAPYKYTAAATGQILLRDDLEDF